MTTNLDIAAIAQQIQDKSSDNVAVFLTFSLSETIGSAWQIHVCQYDQTKTVILDSVYVTPFSDELQKHRMMMLAKYGFNSQYIK